MIRSGRACRRLGEPINLVQRGGHRDRHPPDAVRLRRRLARAGIIVLTVGIVGVLQVTTGPSAMWPWWLHAILLIVLVVTLIWALKDDDEGTP
jgi:hypothetical protein